MQYGGSPIKVGEEEYSLFRDHEYVLILLHTDRSPSFYLLQVLSESADHSSRLLAKIKE